jgi:hypothetical protein
MNETMDSQVERAAGRLKILQAQFADESPKKRRHYLLEELKTVLQPMSQENRPVFLRRLAERFPVLDSVAAGGGAPVPTEDVDPVEHALAACQAVDEERVDELRERLVRQGFGPKTSDDETVLGKLMRRSGLGRMKPAELAHLVQELDDFVRKTDRYVSSVWKKMGPKTRRYPSPARAVLENYLSEEGETQPEELSDALAKLHRTIVALLVIQRAAENFATQYCEKYAPDTIETLGRMEGKGVLESWEHKFWTKYAEVAADMKPRSVQEDFMNVYRETVKRLLEAGR